MGFYNGLHGKDYKSELVIGLYDDYGPQIVFASEGLNLIILSSSASTFSLAIMHPPP